MLVRSGDVRVGQFISAHRYLYVVMTQCEEQVDYQLPKELTCVNFLLDATKCKDPGLNTDIVMVKGKKGPNVKTNKSKDTKAYITP